MKSQKVTVIAKIVVKEEKKEFVKTELLKLIDITKTEKGCINYDLHQDNEDPNLFLFHENWENSDSLQKHIDSAHFQECMKTIKDAMVDLTLNRMTSIS